MGRRPAAWSGRPPRRPSESHLASPRLSHTQKQSEAEVEEIRGIGSLVLSPIKAVAFCCCRRRRPPCLGTKNSTRNENFKQRASRESASFPWLSFSFSAAGRRRCSWFPVLFLSGTEGRGRERGSPPPAAADGRDDLCGCVWFGTLGWVTLRPISESSIHLSSGPFVLYL